MSTETQAVVISEYEVSLRKGTYQQGLSTAEHIAAVLQQSPSDDEPPTKKRKVAPSVHPLALALFLSTFRYLQNGNLKGVYKIIDQLHIASSNDLIPLEAAIELSRVFSRAPEYHGRKEMLTKVLNWETNDPRKAEFVLFHLDEEIKAGRDIVGMKDAIDFIWELVEKNSDVWNAVLVHIKPVSYVSWLSEDRAYFLGSFGIRKESRRFGNTFLIRF